MHTTRGERGGAASHVDSAAATRRNSRHLLAERLETSQSRPISTTIPPQGLAPPPICKNRELVAADIEAKTWSGCFCCCWLKASLGYTARLHSPVVPHAAKLKMATSALRTTAARVCTRSSVSSSSRPFSSASSPLLARSTAYRPKRTPTFYGQHATAHPQQPGQAAPKRDETDTTGHPLWRFFHEQQPLEVPDKRKDNSSMFFFCVCAGMVTPAPRS